MKKKVMCVFGTRPEAIKLGPVVQALQASSDLEPIVVLTAQHREMLDQMLQWFKLVPDFDLDIMRHGQTLSEITSRVITGMDEILQKVHPDLLLVQGDTLTVMVASLAAFYHQIPVGHVEAGLRTDNIYNPFPEEMSRRLVSHIGSMHFAPTSKAVENLAAEDVKKNVFLTGNTVIDALLYTVNRLQTSNIDPSVFGGVDFKSHRVILVTAHRRENWGENMTHIAIALRQIANTFSDVQILFPMHKNPVIRNSIEPAMREQPRVMLVEPLDYVPFVYAMKNCHFILTDSGGIQEEASSLGKPVLVMRTTTERPEAIEAGSAKLVGSTEEGIFAGASELLSNDEVYKRMSHTNNPFGDGKSSQRIVEAITSVLGNPK
jgi:UDP-N-acetylglucosamine 2-epimerase (non-hydrolysing)